MIIQHDDTFITCTTEFSIYHVEINEKDISNIN